VRTLLSIAVLFVLATPAAAKRYIAVGIPGPRLAGSHDGMMKESSIGTRDDPVLGTFETDCPHTTDGNPAILVISDPALPADYGDAIAGDLARHGYTAILLRSGALPTSAQISAMLDAIAAGAAASPLEQGCAFGGKLGLYGNLGAGALVLAAARDREAAGHPVDIVVAVLPGAAEGPDATPALIVDGAPREHGDAKLVVITGLTACELQSIFAPCWKRFDKLDEAQAEHNAAVERGNAVGDYATKFVRGTLDHDEFAAYDFHDAVTVRTITPQFHRDMWSDPEWRTSYSIPAVLGATFARDDTTGAAMIRPEVLVLRVREGHLDTDTRAIGLGMYGEIGQLGGVAAYGTGATFAVGSGRLGFAPSVGYARRGDTGGIAGSVFVGMLDVDDLEHNNLATGFRLDARRFGNETQVTASFQLDLAIPVLGVAAIAMLIDKLDHR